MKKIILSAAILTSSVMMGQVKWKVDGAHSKIGFSVVHMMVSETEGKFRIFDGTVESKSELDFTNAAISFTADAASINTEEPKRDAHLKSADFFDVEKYPTITFKAVSMKPDGKSKTSYVLEGDLTMHGVTKRVKFNVVGASRTVKDPYGNIKMGFKVTGVISRKDFGLVWNAMLEAGGVAVSDEVTLSFNIELNKL